MKSKKNILFVSIANDMYGSSKVLLSLVLQIQKQSEDYHPIVCLPMGDGPLKDIMKAEGIQIIEMPVVKLTRSMLKSFNFFDLFRDYFKAKKILKKELKGMEISCVQSNTLATMFGAFYGVFHKPKHIVHVHEIMDRPKIASFFFKTVLQLFSNHVIYNSLATQDFYNGMSVNIRKKSTLILNGVDRNESVTSEEQKITIRKGLFQANNSQFLTGLIGRINRLKGHYLLLEAFQEVSKKYPNAKLCFVGSAPPNQEFYLANLQDEVQNQGLTEKVSFVDFQDHIYAVLESLDLVVVPSTEPESFGLIVVEAMLSKRAVIGSDIGGISTIIDHGETGLLFPPNDKVALVAAISELIENDKMKHNMEAKAFQKAEEVYSTAAMYQKFIQLYDRVL
ncbi:MAG: glycosyltransferase family 4 protein [Flavobacteriaceae bacterium]|nr:glycosyltransferase family 4 protein [Flavobacteriaceae bacterium]